MPQNQEAVASRIAELGGSRLSSSVGKEKKALPDILRDGELLLAVANGTLEGNFFKRETVSYPLLALTDSRLLFLVRGIFGQSDYEIPIAEVRGLHVESGMFSAELRIDAGGQIKKLTSVDKQLAQNVAQAFSSLRSGEDTSQKKAARIAELAGHSLAFVDDEVKALPGILRAEEVLLAVASGTVDTKIQLLAVTDSRLLLLLRNSRQQSNLEIPIADVRGISVKNNMLDADIEIDAGGQIKKLTGVVKQLARKVEQAFSSLRAGE